MLAGVTLLAATVWFLFDGGSFLVREDPLQRADAVFVLAGTRTERWLEALDLYRQGYAPLIVLSPDRPEIGEQQIRRMGIRFPREPDVARDAMIQMGVPAAAILAPDGYVDNTAAEAEWLRALATRRGWHRVIVVTSKFHTRRAGFAFRRAFTGSGITILVRASQHDPSDPAHWIRTRPDFRFGLSEWEKIVAYWFGVGS